MAYGVRMSSKNERRGTFICVKPEELNRFEAIFRIGCRFHRDSNLILTIILLKSVYDDLIHFTKQYIKFDNYCTKTLLSYVYL